MIVTEPERYQGRVVAVNGSIVDVVFTPPPMQALLLIEFKDDDKDKDTIMLEVAGHISKTMVRAIALTPVAGLKRDQPVSSNGEPLSIPVGPALLGRMLNVFGEVIDNGNALEELTGRYRNVRQSVITSELLDLVAGFRTVAGNTV